MSDDKSRLHISPFSPDLAHSLARAYETLNLDTVSYHSIETFPENTYGFVELSLMEAQKLKKKVNGSILKGKKLRVEEARPQKRAYEEEDGCEGSSPEIKQRQLPSKRLRAGDSTLHGHQLSPDRTVKRGWAAAGKGQQPECLFRVQLPANKSEQSSSDTLNIKKGKSGEKKKRGKLNVVQEFQRTTAQPTFIRHEATARPHGTSLKFVDDKGWVDEKGNLVETWPKRQSRSSKHRDVARANESPCEIVITSAGAAPTGEPAKAVADLAMGHQMTPSNENKDNCSLSSSTTSAAESVFASSPSSPSASEERPASARNVHNKVASSADDEHGPASNQQAPLHPLEAVFKKPKQTASRANGVQPLEIKTSFNFFEEDRQQVMPQTPYTAKDLQLRGLRSAAPTPDTALPTRSFFPESVSTAADEDGLDHVESLKAVDANGPSSKPPDNSAESEFSQWFWKNRGDNNRAWKGRRREALKENRQRENRDRNRKYQGRRET